MKKAIGVGLLLIILLGAYIGYQKSDYLYYKNLLKAKNLNTPMAIFIWTTNNFSNPKSTDAVKSYLSPRFLIENHKRLWCDEGAIIMATLNHSLGFKTRLIDLYGYDNVSHHTVLQVFQNNKWNTFDFTYRLYNQSFAKCYKIYKFKVKTPVIKTYPKLYNDAVNVNYYLKYFIFKIRGINEG
jgi:hypothetical protein